MTKLEIILAIFATLLSLVAIIGGIVAQYYAMKARAAMMGALIDSWEKTWIGGQKEIHRTEAGK